MRFAKHHPAGDAGRRVDFAADACTTSDVLADDVQLPGETHVVAASWAEDIAYLAALPGAEGEIVVVPRTVHHSCGRPLIEVMAVADGVAAGDLSPVQQADRGSVSSGDRGGSLALRRSVRRSRSRKAAVAPEMACAPEGLPDEIVTRGPGNPRARIRLPLNPAGGFLGRLQRGAGCGTLGEPCRRTLNAGSQPPHRKWPDCTRRWWGPSTAVEPATRQEVVAWRSQRPPQGGCGGADGSS